MMVVICVHGDTLLQMLFSQSIDSAIKSFIEIYLLVMDQRTSLQGHNIFVIKVFG